MVSTLPAILEGEHQGGLQDDTEDDIPANKELHLGGFEDLMPEDPKTDFDRLMDISLSNDMQLKLVEEAQNMSTLPTRETYP
ncbi:hypothetical protein CDL15_Pgr027042 [Punica granatum]|uniref:Uncharacterized protein n=1 Tax=Punica granatum TaxID=22663 RepID=A0A218XQ45_PUNGR|nr:hypothetical protein CDL15_Pgr027042 [Punica granatum]